jgi:hypothetical protein
MNPMKFKVEGGVAEIGTDMVLKLSKEQANARAHALEEVKDGWRPKSVVQFKSGEMVEIVGRQVDTLPRSLSTVLVQITKTGKAGKEKPDESGGGADGGTGQE